MKYFKGSFACQKFRDHSGVRAVMQTVFKNRQNRPGSRRFSRFFKLLEEPDVYRVQHTVKNINLNSCFLSFFSLSDGKCSQKNPQNWTILAEFDPDLSIHRSIILKSSPLLNSSSLSRWGAVYIYHIYGDITVFISRKQSQDRLLGNSIVYIYNYYFFLPLFQHLQKKKK